MKAAVVREWPPASRMRGGSGSGVHPVLLRRGRRQHPNNPQLDPFGRIPEYKFCAAKVEPVAMSAAE
jgi:hypothetical protein